MNLNYFLMYYYKMNVKLDMNMLNCVLLVVVLSLVIMCCIKSDNENFKKNTYVECVKDSSYNPAGGGWFTDFCKDSMTPITKYNKCMDKLGTEFGGKILTSEECDNMRQTELLRHPGRYCNSNCNCPRYDARKRCRAARTN